MMDVVWLILALVLLLAGLIGSVAPVLPGPPLVYGGMLLLQLRATPPFTTSFLVVWALIVIVVTVLDYVIPVYGTRTFGGTRYGVWGCTIGLLIGIWFGPLGVILGPLLGAFVGELMGRADAATAWRAALGSFVGFLFSTLLKLIVCCVMGYYMITSLL